MIVIGLPIAYGNLSILHLGFLGEKKAVFVAIFFFSFSFLGPRSTLPGTKDQKKVKKISGVFHVVGLNNRNLP